jgi:hypothetical protein
VAKTVFGGDLAQRIQHLLDERQRLTDTLALIEATLGQIGAVLGPGKRGRKPGRPPASASPKVVPPAQPKKHHRGPGNFATTGQELILAFVKSNKSPTSKQINQEWKKEGRGGNANNILSKMTRERKLKRTPLGKGIKGSRYSVA